MTAGDDKRSPCAESALDAPRISTTHLDGGAPLTLDLLRRAYVTWEPVEGRIVVRFSTPHDEAHVTWEYDFASFKLRVEHGWENAIRRGDVQLSHKDNYRERMEAAEAEVKRLRGLIGALAESAHFDGYPASGGAS